LGTHNTGLFGGVYVYRLTGYVRHSNGKCTYTT